MDDDFDLPPPPGANASRTKTVVGDDPFAQRAQMFRNNAGAIPSSLSSLAKEEKEDAPKFVASAYSFKPIVRGATPAISGAPPGAGAGVGPPGAGPAISGGPPGAGPVISGAPPGAGGPPPGAGPAVSGPPPGAGPAVSGPPPGAAGSAFRPAGAGAAAASPTASAAPASPVSRGLPPGAGPATTTAPASSAPATKSFPASVLSKPLESPAPASKSPPAAAAASPKAVVAAKPLALPAISPPTSIGPPPGAPEAPRITQVLGDKKFGVFRPAGFNAASDDQKKQQNAFAGLGAAVAAKAVARPVNPALISQSSVQTSPPKKNYGRARPEPGTHESREQQAVLKRLQELQLLAPPDGGGEISLTSRDINMVLDAGTSLEATNMYLANIGFTGRKFNNFEALAEAVEETRLAVENEKVRVRKALGQLWTANQIESMFQEAGAGTSTLMFLRQICPELPTPPENLPSIVARMKELVTKERADGKNRLIAYLQGPDCSLFLGPIQLRPSELSRLISNAGGVDSALADLRCMDALGLRFQTFQDVIPALGDSTLANYKASILATLEKVRDSVFEDPSAVTLDMNSVNTLLTISGSSGTQVKESIELLCQFPEKYDGIRDLAEGIRTYAQERSTNLASEMDTAFSFLGANNVFRKQVSVTNSDLKKLVEACFSHYSLVGGPVEPVLDKMVQQKLKFDSFAELIETCGSPAGDPSIPVPPEEEKPKKKKEKEALEDVSAWTFKGKVIANQ